MEGRPSGVQELCSVALYDETVPAAGPRENRPETGLHGGTKAREKYKRLLFPGFKILYTEIIKGGV